MDNTKAIALAAFHSDPLVRDIANEIDDRDASEIAQGIFDLYFGSDSDWTAAGDDEDPSRSFVEPTENKHMTRETAVEVAIFANRCVDWANYAIAYGNFSSPPWSR